MKKIIDNKIVNITNEEFSMYKAICAAYDRENFEGKELFKDHFITNDYGIIIHVKPPSTKHTTMEVFTFLISLMTNQHLRLMQEQVATFISESKEHFKSLLIENQNLKNELSKTVEPNTVE